MDLNKTIERIEANREQTEASFVFCLWKDPQRYDDYKEVNVGTDKTLSCEEPAVVFVNRGFKTSTISLLIHIWQINLHCESTIRN